MKYKVYWESITTGHTGNGQAIDETVARSWLSNTINKRYDGVIRHWLVEVPEPAKGEEVGKRVER